VNIRQINPDRLNPHLLSFLLYISLHNGRGHFSVCGYLRELRGNKVGDIFRVF
jgi:hypothetical protein